MTLWHLILLASIAVLAIKLIGYAVPPRLFELLRSRISALSPRAQDAVEVLALGEPLPYETLAAGVDEEAILELDRAEIVIGDEVDGVLQLRFAHPLLHTVAEHALTGTRRRALARRNHPHDGQDRSIRGTGEPHRGRPGPVAAERGDKRREVRVNARAADGAIEQTAVGEEDVANHFRLQSMPALAGEQDVEGIALRQIPARGGGLAVGR